MSDGVAGPPKAVSPDRSALRHRRTHSTPICWSGEQLTALATDALQIAAPSQPSSLYLSSAASSPPRSSFFLPPTSAEAGSPSSSVFVLDAPPSSPRQADSAAPAEASPPDSSDVPAPPPLEASAADQSSPVVSQQTPASQSHQAAPSLSSLAITIAPTELTSRPPPPPPPPPSSSPGLLPASSLSPASVSPASSAPPPTVAVASPAKAAESASADDLPSRTSSSGQLAQAYHGASVEVYGFVSWICSFVAAFAYLLWAFVPDELLHQWGITYYPAKYWAIAIPTWITVTFFAAVLLYVFLNHYLAVADLDSLEAITDRYARRDSSMCFLESSEAIPQIYDLPLQLVNEQLYKDVSAFD